jgi:hypothetical protein
MKRLPSGLTVEQWFTKKNDLPSKPNDFFYLVQLCDKKSKEKSFYISQYIYDRDRRLVNKSGKVLDFSRWRLCGGIEIFINVSSLNNVKVTAWGKLNTTWK